MRRKWLAGALALCLALSLLPMSALAVEGEDAAAPTITGLSVAGVTATADRGNLYVGIPASTDLSGETFTMTTSEAVTFQAASGGAMGEMYVSSVAADGTVTLTLAVDSDTDSDYSITISSQDNVTWEGTFSNSFDMDAGTLAASANAAGLTLKAGSMKNSSEVSNAAVTVLGNQDMNTAYLVFCTPGQTVNTVNYVVGNNTYTWKLPNGAVLPQPTFTADALEGWYYDADYSQAVTFGDTTTVTGDLTLYGKSAPAQPASFLEKLESGEDVTISSKADWDIFVANASKVVAGQLITLGDDIDCGGTRYTSMTFAGNFNGNNKEISNATFSAASGSKNSGMFDTIGAGQKVCNLKLYDITVNYGTEYSGALVGLLKGSGALVQNVQVTDCTVYGRGAGAIVGLVESGGQVKYCASYDCSVRGAAVAGGIAGFTHATITQSCSVGASCTAVQLNATGGIAGKSVYGGKISSCWTDKSNIYGSTDSWSTMTDCLASVNSNTTVSDFEGIGLDSNWTIIKGTGTSLDMTKCTYTAF